jgi:formyltetrahydrofolate-dependent phosphoribosylglycinamide formyltransferase
MARKRVAVLISGRGSNMASLIAAAKARGYPAEISLVVASRADAAGLARAAAEGIPTATIAARNFVDKASFEAALDTRLAAEGIELICLAGFMRVLSPAFVERWRDRIINIHPSLLPAFPGLDTHARAIAAKVTQHGCTVHFVSAGVDEGPVIAQAVVPVLASDTPEELAARVLAEEHRLYPEVLALVASGRARVIDGRVVIAPAPIPR